jgi:hypothetical protein
MCVETNSCSRDFDLGYGMKGGEHALQFFGVLCLKHPKARERLAGRRYRPTHRTMPSASIAAYDSVRAGRFHPKYDALQSPRLRFQKRAPAEEGYPDRHTCHRTLQVARVARRRSYRTLDPAATRRAQEPCPLWVMSGHWLAICDVRTCKSKRGLQTDLQTNHAARNICQSWA